MQYNLVFLGVCLRTVILSNKVTIKDQGWNKIKKNLMNIPFDVTIGIQGKEAGQDHQGVTNAMLGAVHEYGSSNGDIPQRSFLRSTLTKHEKKYEKEISKTLKNTAEGKSLEGELKIVGEIARADVIAMIKSNIPPALASETVAKKGGEGTALIDTGQLWNSITSEVRKKGQ